MRNKNILLITGNKTDNVRIT